MSIQTLRLRPKLQVNNQLAVENIHALEVAVKLGPRSSLLKEYTPNSYSANGFSHTFYPNAATTFVNRNIYFRQAFDVVVNGVGGTLTGNILDFGVLSALRSYPLHRIMSTFSLSINGTSESYQPYQVIPAFERYAESDEFLRQNSSLTPTMPDKLQNYSQSYTGDSNQIGIVQDPLNSYGNTDKLQGNGRGQFGPGISIVVIGGNNTPGAGNAGSVTIRVTVTECLIHPFLKAFSPNSTALVGIRQMDFNVTYLTNLFASLWSQSDLASAGVVTSSLVTVTQAPALGISSYESSWPIPRTALYTYPKVVSQSQNVASMAPGAITTVNYNSFQIGTELDSVYLFVRENDSTSTITSTNTFPRIRNVDITYNNVNSILASASATQLWQIHNANGGLMSFNEFNSWTGGCIRLDFTKDIPIDDLNSAPGLQTNKNIQINMEIENINPTRTISYTAWIIFVYKGVMNIDTVAMTMETKTSILSREDVFSARQMDVSQAEVEARPRGWFGGVGTKSKTFVPYNSGASGMLGGVGISKQELKNESASSPQYAPVSSERRVLFQTKPKYDLQNRY